MFTSQEVTQAHRSHLYQKVAARRGHSWTTSCYLLYATFWLLPLAWLSDRYASDWMPADLPWLLAAALPLLIPAWRMGAGLPEGPLREPDDQRIP